MRYLGEGIDVEERNRFADELRVWASVGPLLAVAAGAGFSGEVKGLQQATKGLFEAARKLADGLTDEEKQAEAERQRVQQTLRSHPLFVANLGHAL